MKEYSVASGTAGATEAPGGCVPTEQICVELAQTGRIGTN